MELQRSHKEVTGQLQTEVTAHQAARAALATAGSDLELAKTHFKRERAAHLHCRSLRVRPEPSRALCVLCGDCWDPHPLVASFKSGGRCDGPHVMGLYWCLWPSPDLCHLGSEGFSTRT